MITTKPYSDTFAYPSFRPEQDKMLDATWSTLQSSNQNNTIMISAPTGSGKSSVISPAIKYAMEHNMKVLVAVNTKSQISIFVEELERIRQTKQPNLKYSYLMGKSELCSCRHQREEKKDKSSMSLVEQFLADTEENVDDSTEQSQTESIEDKSGDVYEECRLRKQHSRISMRSYGGSDEIEDYGYAVDEDGYYDKNISGCPYYEMVYLSDDGDYSSVIIKQDAQTIIKKLCTTKIMPDALLDEIPIDMCPYELCLQAARISDVVIVNYNHIVVDNVREQLLSALDISTDKIILIIDEAHNLGDRVRNTHMVELTEDNLRKAIEKSEYVSISPKVHDILNEMRAYTRTKFKDEDFKSKSKLEQLPFSIMELVRGFGSAADEDSDKIADVKFCISELEKAINSDKEYSKQLVDSAHVVDKSDFNNIIDFLRIVVDAYHARFRSGETHIGIITMLKKRERGKIVKRYRTLGVMNVDPSPYITKLIGMFYRTIMISGTLEPIESYSTIFFGKNASVDSVVLKNHFPQKNRAILCVTDVDSSKKNRSSSNMLERYRKVIETFCTYVKGNVAIFGPSYAMRDVYCTGASFNGKKLVVEPNSSYYPTTQEIDGHEYTFAWDNREREMLIVDERAPAKATSLLIKEFKQFPEYGIEGAIVGVCGGKMSEGIDYKGDALKGVLILGFPYGAYNEVQKEIIRIYSNKYGDKGNFLSYTLPSLNKAVQAIGRLLRTETDTGVIVLADKRFVNTTSIKSGLPLWISSEMQTTTSQNLKARLNTLAKRGL